MTSELKDLLKQERQLRNTVDGVRKFIAKYKPEKHLDQVEARLDMLEIAMKRFYVVRRRIDVLLEEADEKQVSESKEDPDEKAKTLADLIEKRQTESFELVEMVEDTYCELKAKLCKLSATADPPAATGQQAAPTASSAISRVKLPEIRLPSFGGRIREWVTYRDMFRSLIHRNDQLTEMDKFSYLRSSLTGEALQGISSIEMTAANYPIAWDSLQERYENKKLIVKAHLDALFSVESMKRESYEALSHVINEFDRNLQQLTKIGEDTTGWSTILAYMVCSRLDTTTLRQWESHHSSTDVPGYEDLMEFLRKQASVLQSLSSSKPSQQIESKKPRYTVSHATSQSPRNCPFCGESQHSAFRCQKFLKMKVQERYEKVKRSGLCLNCFSSSHMVRYCTSGTCRNCHQRHHTLLHIGSTNSGAASPPAATGSSVPLVQNRPQKANNQNTQAQNQTTPTQNPGLLTNSHPIASTSSHQPHSHPSHATDRTLVTQTNSLPSSAPSPTRQVLLSTAMVIVTDRNGNSKIARALLDSCSEYCFATSKFCQGLRLAGADSHLAVSGIGGSVVRSSKMVEADISPRFPSISSYTETVQLHVLPKLTATLPVDRVDAGSLLVPEDIVLADPGFHEPGPVDLIIGAEFYFDLLKEGRKKMSDDGPTFQETVFGWVVSGRIPGKVEEVSRAVAYLCSTVDLRELLTKFWELESCYHKSTLSVEESTCEEIFQRTTVRDEDGRFVVTLPKKQYVIDQLGDSKTTALRRFYGLERRFEMNNTLKALYCDFIQEYLAMGHMREVSAENCERPSYYLPHHAVLKPESTTTKLRVVFDASCRTSTGVSLNDGLMVGPVVQDDLLSIILRFRFHRFVVVADIAKMYRMVNVCQADQPLQRILWRSSTSEPVKAYQLTTVTYGTSSAPYLATKCLQQLAADAEATHGKAATTIRKGFYVDDLLTGTDDVEEGKTLVIEILDLMNSAGFTLRKWSSNCAEILSSIPEELRDERATLELDSSSSPVKTLGLIWEPATDMFRYAVPQWNPQTPITKRIVLSDAARIFDPLGLIGPVVVQAKIFLQSLWKQSCDWDDPLPEEFHNYWLEFRRNTIALESLKIPRWTCYTQGLLSVEIHGFCDASEAAYGACLYLRCVSNSGEISVRLITSKSRVAPLEDLTRKKKRQSIPRLELSSALLLSHLYEKVTGSLQLPHQSFFWTDSMIVKCWLSSLPSRWQVFVGNRVSEIQHITKEGEWNHVAGVENPADILSRGTTAAQIQYQPSWFEGPIWLRQDRSTWPKPSSTQPPIDSALLEERSTISLPSRVTPPNELFSLRSSLTDLVRLVAWLRRFVHNSSPRNRSTRQEGRLSLRELDDSLTHLVRISQKESFPEEFADLTRSRQLKSSSKLSLLNPVVIDGTLRVGGRLANAPISEFRKHPMILHHQHPLAALVTRHYHLKLLHAGQQLLIASVREKFWPTNARNLARKICHQCVDCFRSKPKVQEQLMADLPAVRVNPSAVFWKVGVDLCGPFYIKYPIRRSPAVKSYVAIFVCLATKAVHMEIVADLSTQAFLAAFRRFVACRGKPHTVMCDNATNFVGANRELEDLRRQFLDQQFQRTITRSAEDDGIRFNFIPARSPNFGGLWEAAVKSFKGHFRRTIGTRQLSYDELNTIVQQVAAILNSRPLTPLSNDPDDFSALTPGHFLIGRPLTAVPEPDLQGIPENRLAVWQRSQEFVQRLWQTWKTHYLSDLHNRTKWTKQRDNLKIGTMVLVKEDNLPPQRWQLGRVAEIFPGSDGNVRVVTVRTKDGSFKRGISKICVLPIRDNASTSEEF
ncbi:uncharacterized protein LOC134286256 [Aedes albopictus]|uniref:Integrase catalytic domain-containing protein n=2 Tax=Aedes albopictus TaxID=7160 RepID=A0ABM1ZGB9_AEDAL